MHKNQADFEKFNHEVHELLIKSGLFSGKRIAYGTSGFRFNNAAMDFICFRVGAFCSLLSKFLHHQSIGVMITASHNPGDDNGVKIIDPSGNMLPMSLEQILEEFVNRFELGKALDYLENTLTGYFANTEADTEEFKKILKITGELFIGHDTRFSSTRLANCVKEGARVYDAHLTDFGLCSTPMLHQFVRNYNLALQNNQSNKLTKTQLEDMYFDGYGENFKALYTQLKPEAIKNKETVVVDCSNGVGYQVLSRFTKGPVSDVINFECINTNDTNFLNLNCGAEFVQKERKLPSNFNTETTTVGASLDGDADRMVYIYNEKGQISIVDGDKICALTALTASKIVREVLAITNKTIGVVVTAYSNFGLVDLLEKINIPVVMSPTGVKYTHQRAEHFDVGIYFESNGHGTLMLKPDFHHQLKAISNESNVSRCLAAKILLFSNSVF